jgi:hypothetical protein
LAIITLSISLIKAAGVLAGHLPLTLAREE